ncbi:MAG: hypothetical protein PVF73_08305, partial [Bacteroidales bacterium]
MIRNRKLLYILIPATAIIWGAVVWNIVSSLKKPAGFREENYLPFTEDVTDSVEDSYTLLGNYPDPFRTRHTKPNVAVRKETNSQNRNIRTTRRRTNQMRRVIWPHIEYRGVIMNKDHKVALLEVESM